MSGRATRASALAVELVVVVLGVLIALAADSWWGARTDHERAISYLEALAADFEQAERDLETAIEGLEAQVDGITAFLNVIEGREPAPDTTTLPRLGGNPRFFPPTGMIDALLTTGDITLLPDEVRAVLIREQAIVERRMAQNERFADVIVTALRDLILGREELAVDEASSGLPTARKIQRSALARTGYSNMRTGFANQLAEHGAILESVRAVRAAVDAALEDRG